MVLCGLVAPGDCRLGVVSFLGDRGGRESGRGAALKTFAILGKGLVRGSINEPHSERYMRVYIIDICYYIYTHVYSYVMCIYIYTHAYSYFLYICTCTCHTYVGR